MDIYVLIKEIIDTEKSLPIKDGVIHTEQANYIINPYDEYAIEEALRLKAEYEGKVTLVTVGNKTKDFVYKALAMGADAAIEIELDESLSDWDAYSTAKILESLFDKRKADLILCGNVATDGASGQVGPRLAEALGLLCVTSVIQIEFEENKVYLKKDIEGQSVKLTANWPLVVTCQQGLNEPRYPTLPGIMKAKKKTFEHLTFEDLNITLEQITGKTKTISIEAPEVKMPGLILEGTIENQVDTLFDLLKNKDKVL